MKEEGQHVDEILESVSQLIRYIQDNGASLNQATQRELGTFLQQVMTFIEEEETQEQPQEQPQQQPPPPGVPQIPQNAPSADAQLLWILSGQQEQAFISYLRSFPTAATQALLRDPQALSRTMEQLSAMMPQGEQPVVDGIQHADLNSSNVWGSAYDPKTRKMKVRFQGGSEYEYDGIPPNIYNAFIHGNAEARTRGQNQYGRWWPHKNPSLGAALNQYVKAGGFNYRRLR